MTISRSSLSQFQLGATTFCAYTASDGRSSAKTFYVKGKVVPYTVFLAKIAVEIKQLCPHTNYVREALTYAQFQNPNAVIAMYETSLAKNPIKKETE